MNRRLALVTGASAGIGAAFARIYASHGYDVALTARRAEHLGRLAEEIRLRFGVETLTVPADLAEPSAPAAILEDLAANGRAVDVLVNNAGYGLPGAFAETRWADQARFLQVLLLAPTAAIGLLIRHDEHMLTKHVGRQYRVRLGLLATVIFAASTVVAIGVDDWPVFAILLATSVAGLALAGVTAVSARRSERRVQSPPVPPTWFSASGRS